MQHKRSFPLTGDTLTLYRAEGSSAPAATTAASLALNSDTTLFLRLSLPEEQLPPDLTGTHKGFPRAAVLTSAVLSFKQNGAGDHVASSRLLLYRAAEEGGTPTLPAEALLLDFEPAKAESGSVYSFDITADLRAAQLTGTPAMLALTLSGSGAPMLGGATHETLAPSLTLTYETSYGEKTFGKTHTHTPTPHMTATHDLFRGNLLLSIDDLTVGGNVMPFTVRHVYNSAMCDRMFTKNHGIDTAHFSPMRVGLGWRMNLFESMMLLDGSYVYTDDLGEEHKLSVYPNGTYGTLGYTYDPATRTLTTGGDSRTFDSRGRMIARTDGKGHTLTLTYNTDHRIEILTDALGEQYEFTYSEYGYLERITKKSNPATEVRFGCWNGLLTYVWHGSELAFIRYYKNGTVGGEEIDVEAETLLPYSINYRVYGTNTSLFTYQWNGSRLEELAEYEYANISASYTGDLVEKSKITFAYSPYDNSLSVTPSTDGAYICSFDRKGAVLGEYSLAGEVRLHPITSGVPLITEDIALCEESIKVPVNQDGILNPKVGLLGMLDSQRRISFNKKYEIKSGRNEVLCLSAWAKATALPGRTRANGNTSVFRLRAVLNYAGEDPREYSVPFSPDTTDWQMASLRFTPRQERVVTSITVYFDYDYNGGAVFLDEISLFSEKLSSVQYPANDFRMRYLPKKTYQLGNAAIAVDLVTGQLSVSWDDLISTDETRPFRMTHRYHGIERDHATDWFGKKIFASPEASVASYDAIPYDKAFLFIDSEGYECPLHVEDEQWSESGTKEGYSPYCPGLFCHLEEETAEHPAYWDVRDIKGNYLRFSDPRDFAQAKLLAKVDQHGNSFAYEYDSAGYLNKVKRLDSKQANGSSVQAETTVALFETEDGHVTFVRSGNGTRRGTAYTYSDGYLTKATFENGRELTLEYNSDNMLCALEDEMGVRCEFVYEENTVHKIASVRIVAPNQETGDIPLTYDTYTYARGTTSVCDRFGVVTTESYDEKGQGLLSYQKATDENASGDLFEVRRYEPYPVPNHEGEYYLCDREVFKVSGVPLAYEENGVLRSANLLPPESDFDVGTPGNEPEGWIKSGSFKEDDGISAEAHLGDGASCGMASFYGQKSYSYTIALSPDDLPHNGLAFVAHAMRTVQIEERTVAFISLRYDGKQDVAYLSPTLPGWQTAVACLPAPTSPTEVTVTFGGWADSSTWYFDRLALLSVPATMTEYEEPAKDASGALTNRTATVQGTELSYRRSVTMREGRSTVTSYYDASENLLAERLTDGDGNRFETVHTYDEKNRRTRTRDYRDTVTEYYYDWYGNPSGYLQYDIHTVEATLGEGRAYSEDGRFLLREYDPRGTLPNGSQPFTEYVYGEAANGNASFLQEKRMPNGSLRYQYEYDGDLRLHAVVAASASAPNGFSRCEYAYQNGNLGEIILQTGDFSQMKPHYCFVHDALGRRTSASLDTLNCLDVAYDDESRTETVTLGNGCRNTVECDVHGNPIRYARRPNAESSEDTTYTAEYDVFGRAVKTIDYADEKMYNGNDKTYHNAAYDLPKYDVDGNLVRLADDQGRVHFTRSYDREGRLLSHTENRNIRPATYTYAYETRADGAVYPDARLVGVTCTDGIYRRSVATAYDALGRLLGRTATVGNGSSAFSLGESLAYYHALNHTASSTYVDTHTVRLGNNDLFSHRYVYDASGNITEILQADASGETVLRRYTYDLLDRLVRADCADLEKSYAYTYDELGNLTEGKAYAYTLGELGEVTASDSYVYPARDATPSYNQLLSFNGQSIVYDECGNPTTYRGKTLVWEGRRLVGDGERTYVYKADGTRIKKGSTVYKTAGSRILTEEATNYTMSFFYDDNGVSGFLYNGTACYHYVKNLQGDIVALLDNSGAVVAKYLYDPWGVPTVTSASGTLITNPEHIGNLNPFRYRGYYYDKETGWYYLQSRYYDPALRRFLNADVMDVLTVDMMTVADKNLFAYCNGNPVMYSDPTGHLCVTAMVIVGALIGALISSGSKYVFDVAENITDGIQKDDFIRPLKENWKEYLISGLEGAVSGAALSLGVGMGAKAFEAGIRISAKVALSGLGAVAIGGFATGMGTYAIKNSESNNFDSTDMLKSGTRLSLKGALNYGFGLLLGNQGFHTEYRGLSRVLVKNYLKIPFIFPFNMLIDQLLQ